MMKYRLVVLALCLGLFACSEEKSEPLPQLPHVEVPSELAGQYSGQFPCDNCKALIVRAVFAADSGVTAIRTLVMDTMAVDTLQGKYEVGPDSIITLSLPKWRNWNFKRNRMGNLELLNGSGQPYLNEDELKYELIRIFTMPKMKAVPDSSGSQKAAE
ncbi:hypothetical protein [uncultured Fibrobacter sp.]|jgi:hypothetical protein|uniref:hypothetical protein n=1 Tax=uncultured Fibrobacter sp. TaxID=261512 RepID=UPI0025D1D2C8|nr:hypothetical protein [uncultured Fibrobacter sp.]